MGHNIIIGRSESDKISFSDRGLIFLGRGYVKMGQYTSLSNNFFMDVARSHVVLVAGKRGAGKSYTLGVIAEELSNLPKSTSQNIASLIFDTMGIYWTMKYKNEKDRDLLHEWNLKGKTLPVKIFVPHGYYEKYLEKGISIDEKFALDPSELKTEDWIISFGLDITDPVSILIERSMAEIREKNFFGIQDIIDKINEDKKSLQEIKNGAIGLFEAAKTWGIFADAKKGATKIEDLVSGGKTTVLDLSVYNSVGAFNVRALVIGLLSRKIFNQRMDARREEEIKSVAKGLDLMAEEEKRDYPLVWIFIDECLAGNTEIITDKAHTPIQEIVNRFKKGEKFNVLGYDKKENKYGYHPVLNVYRKGKRKVIKVTTETGREITCTPEHRVLTSKGCFASAFSVNDIAFPLTQHYSTDNKLVEARILGHLFGDGWVSNKTKSLGFSGKSNKEDLEKIRTDLSKLGFKSTNIYERKTVSEINHKGKKVVVKGTSQSFQSTGAYKYFKEKAGFYGEKALHPTKIPDSIFNATDKEKSEFLAALMGSDGQIITRANNAKGDFNAIRISFNKIETLEKESFEFAEQIKKLFEDLGIKISQISKKEGNLRKDGNKTIKIVITLKKDIQNTISFLKRIGYRYCSYKELEGLKWLEYLKTRLFLRKEREKIKIRALELKSKGLGKTKISRELNFPESQIRDWIYNKHSPGLPKSFPSFSKWTNDRIKNDILFERIFKIEEAGKEEVYDISIDNVHNFVSNGLITHNCHEFLPKEGKTAATEALIQLLREGRQPGLSLVLATQQPGQIHRDVMTQSDIVISHRVTSAPDLEALNQIMQSYLLESIKQYMDELPSLRGSAIILDDNSERIYPMKIRPRFTWHGGEAPTAVRAEKKL
ncbi:DUF87 domain-containing protein [Candidatus Pacearchaeota archaeon]|nr:DUF87 domain-containing protein [Candidatus Pacearchaeota archaeon]